MIRNAVLLVCLIVAACASQKEPAQALLDEIRLTLAGTAADAAKYVPDQLRALQDEIDALQRSFDRGDYAAVVSRGPAVLAAAGDLFGAATAAKGDRNRALEGEWSTLAETLPDRMSALTTRIDLKPTRSKGKSAAEKDLEARQAALRDVYSLWSKARSAFASRNLDEAVQTAEEVKTKIDALEEAPASSGR